MLACTNVRASLCMVQSTCQLVLVHLDVHYNACTIWSSLCAIARSLSIPVLEKEGAKLLLLFEGLPEESVDSAFGDVARAVVQCVSVSSFVHILCVLSVRLSPFLVVVCAVVLGLEVRVRLSVRVCFLAVAFLEILFEERGFLLVLRSQCGLSCS